MDQKTVELAPFGNIEIDGDKYPQDLSYSVSTVYCETPEEKWNPSPDIHLESQEIPQIQVTEDHSNSCQPDIYRSTEDNELIEIEIEREWQNADHSEPVNFGVNEVTGEKQQDDQDPEEVITYREIRTPDETLLLGV
ncbi:hypothetical protein Avbf_17298 [Armadillidium vulgare]|nr:hypothetical protein Avbf_17298 [Armadillidium vulgare]